MPGKKNFADILKNLPPKTEQPNIFKEMGRALLRIPFDFWEERFYFRGALNTALREKTGHFPARLGQPGETHPVFLLRKLGNFGFQACPCTSKEHGKARYIRKDCLLEITEKRMDRDSYVLSWMPFNLAEADAFRRKLVFLGRVPKDCLAFCGRRGSRELRTKRDNF